MALLPKVPDPSRFTTLHQRKAGNGATRSTIPGEKVVDPLWPRNIAGLVAWYRADLGITLNGSKVSAWADQSGNAHHLMQNVASKQPTFSATGSSGGLSGLIFDGAATWMSGTVGTLPSPFTVYAAMTWVSSSNSYDYALSLGTSAANAGFNIARDKAAFTPPNYFIYNGVGGGKYGTVRPANGAVVIHAFTCGTAAPYALAYENGVADPLTIATDFLAATNTNGALYVGSYFGIGNYFTGTFNEVLIYNTKHTPAQVGQISRAMVGRWKR